MAWKKAVDKSESFERIWTPKPTIKNHFFTDKKTTKWKMRDDRECHRFEQRIHNDSLVCPLKIIFQSKLFLRALTTCNFHVNWCLLAVHPIHRMYELIHEVFHGGKLHSILFQFYSILSGLSSAERTYEMRRCAEWFLCRSIHYRNIQILSPLFRSNTPLLCNGRERLLRWKLALFHWARRMKTTKNDFHECQHSNTIHCVQLAMASVSLWWRIRVHPAIVNASRYLTWRSSALSIHLVSHRSKFASIHSTVRLSLLNVHRSLHSSRAAAKKCPSAIFLGRWMNEQKCGNW